MKQHFAPTGRLRAVINLGNPVLASSVDGQVRGVSVDLAQTLAQRLDVAIELMCVSKAADSVAAVATEQADVGFFAIDPARSAQIAFTAPYLLIEGVYAVRQDSALTRNDEVDQAGHRVMVGHGSAYDLYLSRTLKAAQIVREATGEAVVERFMDSPCEVAAGVKQQLQAAAAKDARWRVLPDRFMVIQQAMGLPRARGAKAHAFLHAFVEECKASGAVAEALARHGITGAAVAGPQAAPD